MKITAKHKRQIRQSIGCVKIAIVTHKLGLIDHKEADKSLAIANTKLGRVIEDMLP